MYIYVCIYTSMIKKHTYIYKYDKETKPSHQVLKVSYEHALQSSACT